MYTQMKLHVVASLKDQLDVFLPKYSSVNSDPLIGTQNYSHNYSDKLSENKWN
jgi:hypothetical protein